MLIRNTSRIRRIQLPFLILILLFTSLVIESCAKGARPEQLPSIGIYDGIIGRSNIILVIEGSNNGIKTGYYIHNGKNAVEGKHNISVQFSGEGIQIMSDEYWGTFQGTINPLEINGSISLKDAKFRLFFWKNHQKFIFTKRTDFQISDLNRYRQELFGTVDVQKDVKYGEAIGYWTETPYLDDPYIEILAKGMVNLFKGEKKLDLNLDIYQPVGDKNQLRPLILLIHGGGFYVGNKQSSTEKIMAEKLAKLGYVVASMDYRLGFKLKGDDVERSGYKAIQDANAALRFLASKANQLKIDPLQVYVAGTSAGAIASLNIAFLDNNERPISSFGHKKEEDLGNIESSGNKLTNKFEIKAVTNLWGAVSDTTIIDSDERIPVLSFHGNQDDVVPIDHSHPFKNTLRLNRLIMDEVYGSVPIHEQLDRLEIENKLVVLDGKGHEPQLDNFKSVNYILYEIIDEMKSFLYTQTASITELKSNLILVSKKGKPVSISLETNEEKITYFEVSGGIKVSSNPNEKKVIWLNDAIKPHITVYTQNRFNAWSTQNVDVEFVE